MKKYMTRMGDGYRVELSEEEIWEDIKAGMEDAVSRGGVLFYETLFDENACCHCALGMGFKEVLPDGDDLTMEQAKQRGINDSIIHVDFMVGADDLAIDGIRPDGTVVPVFRDGTWA